MEDEYADRVYVPGTNATPPHTRDIEPFWPPEELEAPQAAPASRDAPPSTPTGPSPQPPPTAAAPGAAPTAAAAAPGAAEPRSEQVVYRPADRPAPPPVTRPQADAPTRPPQGATGAGAADGTPANGGVPVNGAPVNSAPVNGVSAGGSGATTGVPGADDAGGTPAQDSPWALPLHRPAPDPASAGRYDDVDIQELGDRNRLRSGRTPTAPAPAAPAAPAMHRPSAAPAGPRLHGDNQPGGPMGPAARDAQQPAAGRTGSGHTGSEPPPVEIPRAGPIYQAGAVPPPGQGAQTGPGRGGPAQPDGPPTSPRGPAPQAAQAPGGPGSGAQAPAAQAPAAQAPGPQNPGPQNPGVQYGSPRPDRQPPERPVVGPFPPSMAPRTAPPSTAPQTGPPAAHQQQPLGMHQQQHPGMHQQQHPGAQRPADPGDGAPPVDPYQQVPWVSDGSAPTAEEFARRRLAKPTEPIATMGARSLLHKGTLGLIKPPPGRKEQEYKQDVEMVRRNFGGLRQVTVVNPKGGAGKTVAVLLLAMTFGQKRGGYVLAWDNNETQGTLGMRAQQDFHARTVRDMMRDLHLFRGAQGRVGDLSQYVRAQGEGMFDVLASDESATAGEMLTAQAFGEIREIVSRFYKLIFVDTGNNVRAQNWQAAMDATDQLVITMSARNDSAETAARMLDHLEQSGRQRLVRQAISVVSMPPTRKDIDFPAIQRHFAARTRAVLVAPYEKLIDSGEPLRYGQLSSNTRDHWLKIAAAVAEGL